MKKTNISVVIVSYKTAQLTIESLQTVLTERTQHPELNIHVVVVDNASGDSPEINTAIQTNQWSDWVTLITAEKNGGFGYGNNVGFKYALENHPTVDYFHLLNPDAQLKPGALASLTTFLASHKDVGIAGSSFLNEDGSLWPISFRFPTVYSEIDAGVSWGLVTKLLKKHSIAVNMEQVAQPVAWVLGASMMIRREVVEQLKGFDESYFLYYEETDFCIRAKRLGIDTWYVPESVVTHISGQSTKITERNVKPQRFPSYWYESRRMYFMKNHGLAYTITTDLCTVAAYILGNIKRTIQGKESDQAPNIAEDVFSHSPIFAKNRKLPAFHSQLD